MQVKKFEAKTMKDALEMVKNQLGPDAIILAARDNNKGFGLLGKTSVEITAAVSDSAMQKRKFTESRMTDEARVNFRQAPAKIQKTIVEKSVNRYLSNKKPNDEIVRRDLTRTPYADISDADDTPQIVGSRVDTVLERISNEGQLSEMDIEDNSAAKRIKSAAQSAAQIFEEKVEMTSTALQRPSDALEIRRLKEEITGLKSLIEQLQSLPRTFVNAHPGAELGVSYDLSFMFEKLISGGISKEIATQLMGQATQELPLEQQKNKNLIEAWTAHQIMNSIQVVDSSRMGRTHAFIGGVGQGKTSSLVKLAGILVGKQKKRVLIVGVGNLRVGAHDQLKIYSHILNSRYDVIRTSQDWARVLKQHADVDYILADYPGYSLKSEVDLASLKSLLPPFSDERRVHMVQSVLSKDADATELFRRFLPLRPDDLIFSHLDESVNHGLIYNLQKNFNTPLHSFGTGTGVPDDFEWASRERVLDLIFKLTRSQKGDF